MRYWGYGTMIGIPTEDGFDWDWFMARFTDEKFSLWWAPVYMLDNILTRFIYLIHGTSDLYFMCGVFEGYHAERDM